MAAVKAGGIRAVLVAGSATTLGVLPAFLLGSLAVFVGAELGFNEAQLGLAVSAFFLSSAATAIPSGRLTERVGARVSILLAATASGIAMLGIAFLARSWVHLLGLMLLAGLGNGCAHPAANLVLARGVGVNRQGIAFGMKQSAIPTASLVAGGAVPVIGLTLGWRWAFVGAALGAVLVAILMPREPYASRAHAGRRGRDGDAPVVQLVMLAAAGTCGAAVGTTLASFFVASAVDAGLSPGPAGALLALGSGSAIAARLGLGWFADRSGREQLPVVSTLMALGSVGFGVLAFASWTPALVLGTVLSFAAGWGWPGLFVFAVVQMNRNAPAAATSVTQTGVFVGGVAGPPAFGAVAAATSFGVAWGMALLLNVLGAACVLLVHRTLRGRERVGHPTVDQARIGPPALPGDGGRR